MNTGYRLESINKDNIKKMLASYNINTDKFFYGTIMPKTSSFILLGSAASMNMINAIISYDDVNIYIFKFSFVSNKDIVEYEAIPFATVKSAKVSGFIGIAKRIKVIFNNDTSYLIQANKKFKFIDNQEDSLTNFIDRLVK